MCGIIVDIEKSNKSKVAGRAVINQYQDQIERGQKGFGVVQVFKDRIEIERAVEPVKALMDTRFAEAPIIVFHHRKPTSTDNTMLQTHPFMIEHDELEFDYCVIHNGVIGNSQELMKEHTEELGYAYSTIVKSEYSSVYTKFNDSEALAIEVARHFNGDTEEIGAVGTIAFVAIQIDKNTGKPLTMIWGRNGGNPLECLESETNMLIASKIISLEGEIIPEGSYEKFDIQKYFKSKDPYAVYEAVESGDLKFYVKPEVKYIPKKTNATQKKMGFQQTENVKTLPTPSTISSRDEEEEINDYNAGYYDEYPMTPREKAFDVMAERVIEDMTVSVHTFMAKLAYSQLDDEDIMSVANELNDLLFEKVEIAGSKVRPHFDKKEDEEMEAIVEGDVALNTEEIAEHA